jgi:hypothetical protein
MAAAAPQAGAPLMPRGRDIYRPLRGGGFSAIDLGIPLPPGAEGAGGGSFGAAAGAPEGAGEGSLGAPSGIGAGVLGGGGAGPQLDLVPGSQGRTLPRQRGTPGGGGPAMERVNMLQLTGSATLGAGWTLVGPFAGPVILQPVAAICSGPLLASPGGIPPSDFMALRGRGNGVLYLPWGGPDVRWWIKYAAAGTLTLAVHDARNPALASFLLSHPYASGTQQRTLPTRVTVAAVSTTIVAANVYRTGLLLWPTGNFFLTWGETATTSKIPVTASHAPIYFSDEFNVREAFNGITSSGTADVLYAEWFD